MSRALQRDYFRLPPQRYAVGVDQVFNRLLEHQATKIPVDIEEGDEQISRPTQYPTDIGNQAAHSADATNVTIIILRDTVRGLGFYFGLAIAEEDIAQDQLLETEPK